MQKRVALDVRELRSEGSDRARHLAEAMSTIPFVAISDCSGIRRLTSAVCRLTADRSDTRMSAETDRTRTHYPSSVRQYLCGLPVTYTYPLFTNVFIELQAVKYVPFSECS